MAFVDLELETQTCTVTPPHGYIPAAFEAGPPEEKCRQIADGASDRHVGFEWILDVEEIASFIEATLDITLVGIIESRAAERCMQGASSTVRPFLDRCGITFIKGGACC